MTAEAKKDRFPRNFCVIFSAVFILLYFPMLVGVRSDGVFMRPESRWVDQLFKWREASLRPGDPKIIIAALDAETGQKHTFPVPRRVQARLLDKLKEYGVKTVAFDVMFFDPREGDEELAAATRRFGRVVHVFASEQKRTEFGNVVSIVEPIPSLAKAAQHIGYVDVLKVLDTDGHIRHAKLFDADLHEERDPVEAAPSMDAAIVASYRDEPIEKLRAKYLDMPTRLLTVNFRRPVNWLRHELRDKKHVGVVANLETVLSPFRYISALDLLDGQLTDEQRQALKGSIVFVGSTALGYYDHYPTPLDAQAPGVEYHANNVDNILHDDFVRGVPRVLMLPVILILILLPWGLRRFPPLVGNSAVAGVFLFWLGFVYWRFCRGVSVEFVAPAAALVLSFLAQTGHRVLSESAQKKYIQQTFGQFVAPEVVKKLVEDPSLVKLGGEKREMTVLFLDIAHFTTISEKMKPEALILFLNKYLSALSQVIHEHKGTVDKYIGDCIMAFWNAPLDDAEHRANACLAAVECQQKMAELNKDLDPTLPEVPAIRIGLNAGDMTVGLTGSEKKLAYTVIGDEVNLGSRLEGANKFFGSRIMASEAVYEGAKSRVVGRELGRVRVVGKDIPIRVFELLSKQGELSSQWQQALPLYEAGLKQFHAREFEAAAVSFESVVKVLPKDGPASFYLNASRDYAAIPPEKDWDGVIKLTAK